MNKGLLTSSAVISFLVPRLCLVTRAAGLCPAKLSYQQNEGRSLLLGIPGRTHKREAFRGRAGCARRPPQAALRKLT
jgi:hypothetical protein